MKRYLVFLCVLLGAGRLSAQEITPPKYRGAGIDYYMGRLVGEAVKIADEESVPAAELSDKVVMRGLIDTLGNVGEWQFLDNTCEGNDFREQEPATPRTRELLRRAAERLGEFAPAERNGRKVSYRQTMRLTIPVGKIAAKQEAEPLLFLGKDPATTFHDWARVRIRTTDSKAIEKGGDINVHVRFYIEPDGRITNVEVVDTNNEKLAKETVRVVKASKGKWTPRCVRGVPQRTVYDYRLNRFFDADLNTLSD